jgi:hypothetical protein
MRESDTVSYQESKGPRSRTNIIVDFVFAWSYVAEDCSSRLHGIVPMMWFDIGVEVLPV